MYAGLVRSQGREIVRIRFSLDLDKSLDLPRTAETLAYLAQFLGCLGGKVADEMPTEIEALRQNGGLLEH